MVGWLWDFLVFEFVIFVVVGKWGRKGGVVRGFSTFLGRLLVSMRPPECG